MELPLKDGTSLNPDEGTQHCDPRDKRLDSTQTLYLKTDRGVVSEVRIQVDDQAAVDEFWS